MQGTLVIGFQEPVVPRASRVAPADPPGPKLGGQIIQHRKMNQMHDPKILQSLGAFGHTYLPGLETLLSNVNIGEWGERLRCWMAACANADQGALCYPALKTAVVDLVTLELACQSYAFAENGLRLTDRGGTVWARRALADLLLLLSERDTNTARQLASLAWSTRNARLNQIRSQIIERT